MKYFFPALAVAAVALLALWRPASHPGALAIATAPPVAVRYGRGSTRLHAASGRIVVYVAGAVARAGLYRLAADARADDAVRAAGGFRPDADRAAVNLAQRLSDGDEVRVYGQAERTPRVAARSRMRGAKHTKRAPPPTLDINAAGAADLARLPGLGATLAARIVEFRRLNGAFATLDELLDVAGMTQRRLDSISPYLVLNGGP